MDDDAPGGSGSLFGQQAERRAERALIEHYIGDLHLIAGTLSSANAAVATELAELPNHIRGFGPVKDGNRAKAEEQRKALLLRIIELSLHTPGTRSQGRD